MNEVTEWDLLDALHADYVEKDRKPGEFNVKEWQARYKHRSHSAAYKELMDLIQDGKLQKRDGRENGRPVQWFSVTPPPNDVTSAE